MYLVHDQVHVPACKGPMNETGDDILLLAVDLATINCWQEEWPLLFHSSTTIHVPACKGPMNETREAILLLAVDRCNMTAVRQFIEVGASMEITVPEDGPTATALHSCVLTREIAHLLIDNGVEISRANESEECCCGR
jgi:hypothetical protein